VKKRARNARGKGAGVRPAYGHIRSVADLDYDPDSDEDTAALREHRNECEKCHMKPAHELLEAERKRPKAKGRKRRKTSDDDLEESGDEVERITKKGGWVRWSVQLVLAEQRYSSSSQSQVSFCYPLELFGGYAAG
jgi:hypothetical protein